MKMNSLLQKDIEGVNLKDINPNLPSGIIETKEGYLKSKPIPPAESSFISGRFDIISKLDDGTFAIIDFKISDPTEEKVQKFTHQLHAYKFALENPQEGERKNVSKMGLVIVAPEQIGFKNGFVYFKSTPQWFEIKEDMAGFLNFIGNVNEVLDSEPPQPSPECKWCIYRTYFEPKADIDSDELPF